MIDSSVLMKKLASDFQFKFARSNRWIGSSERAPLTTTYDLIKIQQNISEIGWFHVSVSIVWFRELTSL